ncbi:MAG: outer membrane lipoprotein-sorting protein [Bacteroidales bacterium]|nr:outer membrane lipoprotein-sorting protein [Bacteroidales bacterium]
MKNFKMKLFALTGLIILSSIFTLKAQDADAILKKVDAVMFSAKDMKGKTKIILINKAGKQSTREAVIIQKGNDKRLFRFTAPASQAGIATLSLPNDIMYLYLPSFGKERRISSSVKSQKFAGTDFTYDDMEAISYTKKYTPKYIKTEGNTFVLELKPKSPKSQYSKIIVKIHKTNYYPTFMEFYDKGNKKIKSATYSFKKNGKYWNPYEIVMKDIKNGHITKMISSSVQYDTGLTDDDFTVRKLKQ